MRKKTYGKIGIQFIHIVAIKANKNTTIETKHYIIVPVHHTSLLATGTELHRRSQGGERAHDPQNFQSLYFKVEPFVEKH